MWSDIAPKTGTLLHAYQAYFYESNKKNGEFWRSGFTKNNVFKMGDLHK